MNFEKLSKIGIRLAKDFFKEMPETYNPKELEEYLFSFLDNLPSKIGKAAGIGFLEKVAIKYFAKMSWKEFVNMMSEILCEIPGDDSEKSVEYVIKNFQKYLSEL